MSRKDTCKFNSIINCKEQDKCESCNWNPTYFEEKKKSTGEAKGNNLQRSEDA